MITPDIDHGDSAAKAYQAHFEHLLKLARESNDGLFLTDAQTNQLRGRIALLKELIALPKAKALREAQLRIEHPV